MKAVKRERIKNVMQRFITEPAEMEAVMRGGAIMKTVSIDSLAVVTMVADLEKEFGVRFDYESMEKDFETIETLERFLLSETG